MSRSDTFARDQPSGEQPVAIVTGAGRNIGYAIASRLQADGYQIVATAYAGDPMKGLGAPASVTIEQGRDFGRRHQWDVVECDLTNPGQCQELIGWTQDRYGRLDCLVNNAATWTYGPALSISDEDWCRVFDVNVLAIVRLVRSARDLLRAAPAPRIISISSTGAEWAGNGVAPYNVSKAGVSALTRALAVELAPDGILVNAVAPGFIDTTSNSHEFADPAVLHSHLSLIPLGRPGSSDEVATLVSFLASPRLGFLTGCVIRIDGGQLAGASTAFSGQAGKTVQHANDER
jgi:NAD(P)-dependent dehydrogenase (short-subunit alcohol dehydrogenase family)